MLAYFRADHQGESVVVVANFSDQYLAGYHVPDFRSAGTWHKWMGKSEVEIAESGLGLDLPESEAKVFVCR